MHKVRGNYSSCTCRSSENICSNSGSAQEKGKMRSMPIVAYRFDPALEIMDAVL